MKEPFTTFLPNVDEQAQLINELVVLVGHKWASHIPALQWFKGHLPTRIHHEHMEEMKMKTKKVTVLYIVSKNLFEVMYRHFSNCTMPLPNKRPLYRS